ncbi:hypothetical protein CBE85_18500 [Acinetobacter baumannii]|uniref:Uncharacterized protein n=1 Tax=Acinetobacter baumannii TaxID=470 RepID=A0A854N479_ACIBA|nr:hypothetical protein CBE85_18500 [Acinetobacter baumannii]
MQHTWFRFVIWWDEVISVAPNCFKSSPNGELFYCPKKNSVPNGYRVFSYRKTGNGILREQYTDLLTDVACQKPSPAIVHTISKGYQNQMLLHRRSE